MADDPSKWSSIPELTGRSDAAELPAGTIITLTKRFKIVSRLGEGGMGKVFKAFDPIMNRYVALKVMKQDVPESEQRRFRLEARLGGSFLHPNLVRALEVGTTSAQGLFWFAMDFLDGRDISGALEAGRAIPFHVICEIFSQTLDALRYVHLRKIVHRDVKPANIFVTRDAYDPGLRIVKLLDFGVALDLNDDNLDEGKLILGDPRYIAPEQTRPGAPIDYRADLYALGMTFYEAATGHHPFEDLLDGDPRTLIRAHREREPEPPSRHLAPDTNVGRSRAIDDFFARAAAKDPEARFGDSREMKRALMAMRRYI